MKMVFIASIAGKETLETNYSLINKLCKKLGHKIFDDYIFEQSPEILSSSSFSKHKENYKKITSEIKDSDVMIAESTQSSLGVGRLISIALQLHKPILVLYSKYPPRTLVVDPTRLIILRQGF